MWQNAVSQHREMGKPNWRYLELIVAKMQDWRWFLSEPSSLSNMIRFRAEHVWRFNQESSVLQLLSKNRKWKFRSVIDVLLSVVVCHKYSASCAGHMRHLQHCKHMSPKRKERKRQSSMRAHSHHVINSLTDEYAETCCHLWLIWVQVLLTKATNALVQKIKWTHFGQNSLTQILRSNTRKHTRVEVVRSFLSASNKETKSSSSHHHHQPHHQHDSVVSRGPPFH